jgi:voltage-gated potassium channel
LSDGKEYYPAKVNIVDPIYRLVKAGSLLTVVIIISTLGYMLIEHWRLLDAFFMTLITVSTVGYREVHPLSDAGRLFTLFVIFFGVGTLFYTLAVGVEAMIEGHISGVIAKARFMKQLSRLKDHYILCGYGRVGEEIAKEMAKHKVNFVLVEKDTENISKALDEGVMALRGSATEDDILLEAGIKRAKGLLTALSSDADNVFVTLTAKTLNPDIFVVARGEEEESTRKLMNAGADRVVSPYTIGGRRMASLLVKPLVTDYIEMVVTKGKKVEFELEEIVLDKSSPLVGKTISEARIRDETGVLILALQRDGELNNNPSATTKMEDGDILLAIGTSEHLGSLAKYAKVKERK